MSHPPRTPAQRLFAQASALLAGGPRFKPSAAHAAIAEAEETSDLTLEEMILLGVLRGALRCGDAHPQRKTVRAMLGQAVTLVAKQEKPAPLTYTDGARHLAERNL